MPSESRSPVGLIAGGALEPFEAAGVAVAVWGLGVVVAAVPLAGHCASGGAMQLERPTSAPRLAVTLFLIESFMLRA
jgi:hypothetical protein